ncbi:MAG TPA: MATE family efflux transporter [Polyangia bacterium]|jgi:putative MATE family efflux protein|nr:MATE family efflux transporter [Polyangia bacterium]
MSGPEGAALSTVEESAAPSAERAGFWPLVREALAGSRRDLTSETLGRAILLLAVPMVLEMVMESIFAISDIFWVSKLGADAVAVGVSTESLMTIVYTLAMGLATGTVAMVARRSGAKDADGAARAAVQGIILGVVVSAVIGVLGVVAGTRLLALAGAPPTSVAIGGPYARVMLGGSVTVLLLFVINSALRGVGDASLAMRTLWLANGINIVLGPCLIFGWGPFPRLGVTGAAVATTIGRGVGVLYQLRVLARGRGRLLVRRAHLVSDAATQRTIVRLSASGTFQTFIGMASWVPLNWVVARFGANVLAGYGIAFRVVMFALLPAWGLGNAAATLVGQNLGARHPERAERAVWRAALYNFVFLGSIGVVLVVFASEIVRLFSRDAEIVASGGSCLRIVAAGFLFYAYGMVVTQAFNGAGDTRTPMVINVISFWAWEIPAAYLLSGPVGLGPTGVFVSIATAFSLSAVLGVALFRRGRWKSVQV